MGELMLVLGWMILGYDSWKGQGIFIFSLLSRLGNSFLSCCILCSFV